MNSLSVQWGWMRYESFDIWQKTSKTCISIGKWTGSRFFGINPDLDPKNPDRRKQDLDSDPGF